MGGVGTGGNPAATEWRRDCPQQPEEELATVRHSGGLLDRHPRRWQGPACCLPRGSGIPSLLANSTSGAGSSDK